MNTESKIVSISAHDKDCLGCKRFGSDILLSVFSSTGDFHDHFLTQQQAEELHEDLGKRLGENRKNAPEGAGESEPITVKVKEVSRTRDGGTIEYVAAEGEPIPYWVDGRIGSKSRGWIYDKYPGKVDAKRVNVILEIVD